MLPLLALSAALAAPSFVGEKLRWDIAFAGVTGGQAWSEVVPGAEGAVYIEAGAKNADWYERVYSIDDFVRSTWVPGAGSRRYETRFREGRFQQDQDMRLTPAGVSVWRKQRFEEGWREWSDDYAAAPGAEDPISAFYALRLLEGEGPWRYPVFSGKATWPLVVEPMGRETLDSPALGTVAARVYSLRTQHRGDWEQRGRFLVYLTDDARRIPVQILAKASIGSIRATLVEYRPPR